MTFTSPALVSNALYETPCAENNAFAALTNSQATVLAESAEWKVDVIATEKFVLL